MKAKFVEGSAETLGIAFEPETDDERLLLQVFARQCEQANARNLLSITGWGLGGERPGMRHIRVTIPRTAEIPNTVIASEDEGTP